MRFLEEMRLLICLGVLSLFACTSPLVQSDLPDETRKMIDSIVRVTPGIDSLSILLDRFEAEGNKYGMMSAVTGMQPSSTKQSSIIVRH